MAIGNINETRAVVINVTLSREDVERILLKWLDENSPAAKRRFSAEVAFTKNANGDVTGARIEATATAQE